MYKRGGQNIYKHLSPVVQCENEFDGRKKNGRGGYKIHK